jgi:MFS family permease
VIVRLSERINIPLAAITTEGFLSRFSFGMINFAVPLYALALGMNLSEVGFLVSLRLGIGLLLTPVAGWAADTLGRRRLLLGGLTVRVLVPFLFMIAAVPWHLVAIRMLHGASTAARDPAASSLLADHADEGRLASAFAWQATARHVGGTLGAGFAGVLISLSGSDYDIVFGAAVVLSLLPLLITADLVAEVKDEPEQLPDETRAGPEATTAPEPTKSSPPLAPLAFMGMAISGASHMIHGLFPLLATEYAGLSAAEAGVIYTASGLTMLVSGPAFGWLADRTGTGPILLVRSLANAVSSLLYLGAPNLAGMAAGHMTDDLGKAAFRPAWGATMAEVASHDRRRRTRRLAFMDTGRESGETFAPLLGGFIWDIWGVTALLVARIGLAIAAECYSLALSARFHLGRGPTLQFPALAAQVNGSHLPACAFCTRPATGLEALTNLDAIGVWHREIAPLCSRCNRLLKDAGGQGLVLKATDERWWSGHSAAPSVNAQPAISAAIAPSPAKHKRSRRRSTEPARRGAGLPRPEVRPTRTTPAKSHDGQSRPHRSIHPTPANERGEARPAGPTKRLKKATRAPGIATPSGLAKRRDRTTRRR